MANKEEESLPEPPGLEPHDIVHFINRFEKDATAVIRDLLRSSVNAMIKLCSWTVPSMIPVGIMTSAPNDLESFDLPNTLFSIFPSDDQCPINVKLFDLTMDTIDVPPSDKTPFIAIVARPEQIKSSSLSALFNLLSDRNYSAVMFLTHLSPHMVTPLLGQMASRALPDVLPSLSRDEFMDRMLPSILEAPALPSPAALRGLARIVRDEGPGALSASLHAALSLHRGVSTPEIVKTRAKASLALGRKLMSALTKFSETKIKTKSISKAKSFSEDQKAGDMLQMLESVWSGRADRSELIKRARASLRQWDIASLHQLADSLHQILIAHGLPVEANVLDFKDTSKDTAQGPLQDSSASCPTFTVDTGQLLSGLCGEGALTSPSRPIQGSKRAISKRTPKRMSHPGEQRTAILSALAGSGAMGGVFQVVLPPSLLSKHAAALLSPSGHTSLPDVGRCHASDLWEMRGTIGCAEDPALACLWRALQEFPAAQMSRGELLGAYWPLVRSRVLGRHPESASETSASVEAEFNFELRQLLGHGLVRIRGDGVVERVQT
eukprot:gnl/Dysnectes_brevis/3942_a5139_533.p1 GENE.gnl/Dysnectes_brevis/3942_a5139_533~~gnl/Dysnectes_brevis/3942_a5139_533.p1  ORF type:complete len:551 (+),score=72.41 gnl/Dysnectes_brevis/3942_a5139_533:60-1712(+)